MSKFINTLLVFSVLFISTQSMAVMPQQGTVYKLISMMSTEFEDIEGLDKDETEQLKYFGKVIQIKQLGYKDNEIPTNTECLSDNSVGDAIVAHNVDTELLMDTLDKINFDMSKSPEFSRAFVTLENIERDSKSWAERKSDYLFGNMTAYLLTGKSLCERAQPFYKKYYPAGL
jgi:hypothetical protein